MDFVEKVKKDLAFGSRDGCYGQACRDCEYYVNESCSYHKTEVMRDALVVIESQQKEIERLEAQNRRYKSPDAYVDGMPEACRNCSNHPSNGGSGNCNCMLGSMGRVTC